MWGSTAPTLCRNKRSCSIISVPGSAVPSTSFREFRPELDTFSFVCRTYKLTLERLARVTFRDAQALVAWARTGLLCSDDGTDWDASNGNL
jgi:hypothetical protein